jgi:RNA polymerase sigma-70 factor (ECF subfamily)
MTSDKENLNFLLQRLQQGSEHAFTVLYDKFSKPLYRNILRLVKDEDIAQELLQDLFLKIWDIRAKINPEKSFKSFLYKIAQNLVYTHFSKIAKNERLIAKLAISYAEYDDNVEEKLISKENHQQLKMAIDSLPPQRKLIYSLCKLDGKSYAEVSQELGISTDTVSSQIVKANKAVRMYFMVNKELALLFVASQVLIHTK